MEKRLVDFETELTEDMPGLCDAYERNIRSISGLYSLILVHTPSIRDYMCWLTAEVACLPEVFTSVNENFILVVIEGVVVMAGDSVDLAALRDSTTNSGADVLPGVWETRKTTSVITHDWWRSFGYKSTLATVQAKLREVNHRVCRFWI
jgi:hypothetical protein